MLDYLYKNVGDKIQSLSKGLFVVEAISSIIASMIMAFNEDFVYILGVVVGPIVALVSSWFLYAFGQLVEDIHNMRKQEAPLENASQTKTVAEPEKNISKIEKIVYVIGRDIPEGTYTVSAKNPQGGMLYSFAEDKTPLDKRYIKKNEKFRFKYGTVIELYDCEIIS